MSSIQRHGGIETMSPGTIEAAEARMQPGIHCDSGFLGEGESFETIVAEDKAALDQIGITAKQIGDRITYLTEAVAAVDIAHFYKTGEMPPYRSKEALAIEGFAIREKSYRGGVYCPMSVPYKELPDGSKSIITCGYGSADYQITNPRTDETLDASMLGAHMASEHAFLQGSTPYRIDPVTAARILELKPGVNYEPVYTEIPTWRAKMSRSIRLDTSMHPVEAFKALPTHETPFIYHGLIPQENPNMRHIGSMYVPNNGNFHVFRCGAIESQPDDTENLVIFTADGDELFGPETNRTIEGRLLDNPGPGRNSIQHYVSSGPTKRLTGWVDQASQA